MVRQQLGLWTVLCGKLKNGTKTVIDIRTNRIAWVWTILDAEDLAETGQPRHFENAFLEDQLHDWSYDAQTKVFSYHPHSSEKGDERDVLIILY